MHFRPSYYPRLAPRFLSLILSCQTSAQRHSRRIWQVHGMSANGPISDTPARHYGDVNLAQRAQIVRHVDDFSAVGEPSIAFIAGPMPVATRGRRTKGKLRWLPSTAQTRSRISANDGSVVGRSKQASFDHPVCSRDSVCLFWTCRPSWQHRSSQRTQIIQPVAEFPDRLGIAEFVRPCCRTATKVLFLHRKRSFLFTSASACF
jgi:hypothetical protein